MNFVIYQFLSNCDQDDRLVNYDPFLSCLYFKGKYIFAYELK